MTRSLKEIVFWGGGIVESVKAKVGDRWQASLLSRPLVVTHVFALLKRWERAAYSKTRKHRRIAYKNPLAHLNPERRENMKRGGNSKNQLVTAASRYLFTLRWAPVQTR